MPEEHLQPAQLDPICIRTTQVYDWCYSNGTHSVVLTDIVYPADTSVVAGVEASVVTMDCAEINRDQEPNGLAYVTIRRLVTFELTFVDAAGTPVPVIIGGVEATSQVRTRFFDEFYRICAPVGTTLACEVTDSGARATMTVVNGTPAILVEIFACHSLQSTAEVMVSIDIHDYCIPDTCETGPKPFECPPAPTPPPACSPPTSLRRASQNRA